MIVTRFAPSPTGLLHIGHAYAAIVARESGERFLLRLEDIDRARCREEFASAIVEDLSWLGLSWDGPVLRQSTRFDAYRAHLETLAEMSLVYPCFCTRKEIAEEIAQSVAAPQGPEGPLYPGTCRGLAEAKRSARIASGMPYALRLDVARAATIAGPLEFVERPSDPGGECGTISVRPMLFGDIVLARKDAPASYHLAVVADDAHTGVTLVTRGNDLFAATNIQRLLQALLGLPMPEYAHHKLIFDARGKKISKRDQTITLRSLREGGVSVNEVRKRVARAVAD